MIHQVLGTVVGRWYVTAFGLIFLAAAVRHLGRARTTVYIVIALLVGVAAENGSVLSGFPYTRYTFNPALRGHELWIWHVPLMVPLSYTFLAYFAFGAARLIVSGPRQSRGTQPVLEYLLAVVLATWALWIVDPVTRLGPFPPVGELFQYDGPGFWFGLPLGSQLGFAFTAAVLIGVLTAMARTESAAAVPRLRRHPRLVAMVTYCGEVIFMAGVAFVVARTTDQPHVVQVGDSLAGATLIIAIPVALLVTLYWRSLLVDSASTSEVPPIAGTRGGEDGQEKC